MSPSHSSLSQEQQPMVPDNRSPKRPVTVIDMAGYLFLVVGILLGLFGNSAQIILGSSFVIFSGLCFVAAAIRESAADLKNRD